MKILILFALLFASCKKPLINKFPRLKTTEYILTEAHAENAYKFRYEWLHAVPDTTEIIELIDAQYPLACRSAEDQARLVEYIQLLVPSTLEVFRAAPYHLQEKIATEFTQRLVFAVTIHSAKLDAVYMQGGP